MGIDRSCSALLMFSNSMLRGLHNSSIYSLHTTHRVESDFRTPILGDKVPVNPIEDKDLRKLDAM